MIFFLLGHKISDTDTNFIEDKWTEWSDNNSKLVSSKIRKGIISTF